MGYIEYPEILLATICFFVTFYLTRKGLPWNWPFLGMLPGLLVSLHCIHQFCFEILKATNCSFLFKGPCFAKMDIFLTVDPTNIQYIMTTNFTNYPKGDEFSRIFEILGEGIFNSDGDLWKFQRKITHTLISHKKFMKFLVKVTCDKVENGLVPILQHASKDNLVIDLQDVFQRLTFDTTCLLVTGHDPSCLTTEFQDVPFSKALDDAEEALAMRHLIPENIWRLNKKLGIGHEKILSQAWKILDHFIDKIVSMKRQELESKRKSSLLQINDNQEGGVDLLTMFITSDAHEIEGINTKHDKFLRDTILNLMLAGRDTTSSALTWFIWLITQNPRVKEKIREELRKNMAFSDQANKWHLFKVAAAENLTYLHATLCESLRLYPPVPVQHKSPLKPDTLPSGHHVTPEMKIVFSLYAMARMKGIWGDDCLEFKPERWITEQGKIKYEPPYKFLCFNAGPRTCLGKEVAFTQMKMVGATLIHNYEFKVVNESNAGELDVSIILHMKHGLKVEVSNRWSSVNAN